MAYEEHPGAVAPKTGGWQALKPLATQKAGSSLRSTLLLLFTSATHLCTSGKAARSRTFEVPIGVTLCIRISQIGDHSTYWAGGRITALMA